MSHVWSICVVKTVFMKKPVEMEIPGSQNVSLQNFGHQYVPRAVFHRRSALLMILGGLEFITCLFEYEILLLILLSLKKLFLLEAWIIDAASRL